jgi:hypothetical protein
MGVFPQEENMLQATLDVRESLAVERFVDEQMFEEDVRSVLQMMRPHRRERLMGWKEYRTGGADFRVTVSWNSRFESTAPQEPLTVPHMTDIIESFLVGSAKDQDEITPQQEFGHYRAVVAELARRIDEMVACYT